jgi:hypothetical protein
MPVGLRAAVVKAGPTTVTSEGLQSRVPPELGTVAIPSTEYVARVAVTVSVGPLAAHAPILAAPDGRLSV